MDKIIIYCDGACAGNQFTKNIGGWGAILKYKDNVKEIYDGELNTTNNKMELISCIKALELINKNNIPIELYTDSAYVCNCINQKWYVKWKNNGWINSQKKPVENKDLWVNLLNQLEKFSDIKFFKVKGHSGEELNESADQLAQKGINQLRQ